MLFNKLITGNSILLPSFLLFLGYKIVKIAKNFFEEKRQFKGFITFVSQIVLLLIEQN